MKGYSTRLRRKPFTPAPLASSGQLPIMARPHPTHGGPYRVPSFGNRVISNLSHPPRPRTASLTRIERRLRKRGPPSSALRSLGFCVACLGPDKKNLGIRHEGVLPTHHISESNTPPVTITHRMTTFGGLHTNHERRALCIIGRTRPKISPVVRSQKP